MKMKQTNKNIAVKSKYNKAITGKDFRACVPRYITGSLQRNSIGK